MQNKENIKNNTKKKILIARVRLSESISRSCTERRRPVAVNQKATAEGFSANLAKVSAVASVSKCGVQDSAKLLSATVRPLHGFCQPTNPAAAYKDVTIGPSVWLIRSSMILLDSNVTPLYGYGLKLSRHLHASRELLAKRKEDDSLRLKNSKRVKSFSGKFSKRKKENKPPVETPYVPPKLKRAAKSLPDKTIEIFEGITIGELAKRCGESIPTIQNIIVNVGEKADSEFDGLSIDIAELVAMEVGINVHRLHSDEGVEILPRPPVVTVMGHVDHGKTSLLDALRQTSLAAREAGGITQHLGAFVVGMQSGAAITFLDTPGHAAFSAMRARGAAVTDVVVLVVAADDGVMPQTLEAMAHAKAAGVPVVVAINKCDKRDADPERVKVQLASEGLMLEEMGGDVQVVEVSAVNKTGLDQLEEALLLQAELMDLKARVDGPAQAYVVEARVDKGRGPLATAIVKKGTLVCGQDIVIGSEWGKIRCIRDMSRNMILRATPSMPIEIEGLKGLPMAGDDIVVVVSEERARMLSEGRKKKERRKLEEEGVEKWRLEGEEHRRLRRELKLKEEEEKKGRKSSEDGNNESEGNDSEEESKTVEVPIIVKGDVQGTVQAVSDALKSLNSPQVLVKVIHAGVGPVSQSDVDMAKACGACIVGFNVRDLAHAVSQAASQAKIKIVLHRVIYHLLEDIGNLIVERAPGTLETEVAGEAQVLNIFEVKGKGKGKGDDFKIAGCRVVDGRVSKSATLRLLRSGETLFEGCCASLKREQHDVDAVGKGNECGLVIKDWADFRVGDVVQCLVKVKRKPKFVSSESGAVRIEC
ncbi:translation initiation factor IF-2 [Striga asiatica]|uniref:Translation initiation factor IF-2, mitochondrial n=1 Tax=Striga asiatica TaxID=4170 RepID=A0A5A7Q6M7_STRAF|nr:translation initiation factor IF-2 [Striga asiatica]